ncbi:DUF4124 domain-containing protein [Aquisalimonas lutea]|uniref:DUF4124 domain-containing protein n=1 Tax=Aquisalimonas lutea TaxID=1327750 RepID=UPI0025B565B5|nr:DUF4124 domain-containing protein [Aquisalimonas lutea]MDN3516629.1 DUF4124 domain-containing protein [Aquisalimonas lutea]
MCYIHDMRWMCLFFFAVLLVPLAAAGEIYKHVDEDGNVTYTDEPIEGAERLESPEPESVYRFRTPERLDASGPAEPQEPEAPYQSVRILQPRPEGTVRDNRGIVEVRVGTEPQLRQGHAVEYILDGEVRGDAGPELTRRLTEVHRGEHQIRARIVDGNGETIAESESVTFYMHQASRLHGGGQGSGSGGNDPGGVAFPGN